MTPHGLTQVQYALNIYVIYNVHPTSLTRFWELKSPAHVNRFDGCSGKVW